MCHSCHIDIGKEGKTFYSIHSSPLLLLHSTLRCYTAWRLLLPPLPRHHAAPHPTCLPAGSSHCTFYHHLSHTTHYHTRACILVRAFISCLPTTFCHHTCARAHHAATTFASHAFTPHYLLQLHLHVPLPCIPHCSLHTLPGWLPHTDITHTACLRLHTHPHHHARRCFLHTLTPPSPAFALPLVHYCLRMPPRPTHSLKFATHTSHSCTYPPVYSTWFSFYLLPHLFPVAGLLPRTPFLFVPSYTVAVCLSAAMLLAFYLPRTPGIPSRTRWRCLLLRYALVATWRSATLLRTSSRCLHARRYACTCPLPSPHSCYITVYCATHCWTSPHHLGKERKKEEKGRNIMVPPPPQVLLPVRVTHRLRFVYRAYARKTAAHASFLPCTPLLPATWFWLVHRHPQHFTCCAFTLTPIRLAAHYERCIHHFLPHTRSSAALHTRGFAT